MNIHSDSCFVRKNAQDIQPAILNVGMDSLNVVPHVESIETFCVNHFILLLGSNALSPHSADETERENVRPECGDLYLNLARYNVQKFSFDGYYVQTHSQHVQSTPLNVETESLNVSAAILSI